MHGIRVAEQVMQIAQYLLIRAEQKRAKNVRTAIERMQRKRLLDVAAVDELVHLAVGIARDVTQHSLMRRRLIEPVDRHNRKQLFHRPAIRHALKQREIAKIRVGKQSVKSFQLFWKVIEFAGQLQNLTADRPIKILGETPLHQRKITKAEKIQRRIERLLRIVIRLKQVLFVERAMGFKQIDQRLLGIFGDSRRKIFLAESADAQNVEHEHAMIRRYSSTAFRNDRRMRNFGLVADVLNVVNNIARVFL